MSIKLRIVNVSYSFFKVMKIKENSYFRHPIENCSIGTKISSNGRSQQAGEQTLPFFFPLIMYECFLCRVRNGKYFSFSCMKD